jgi:hypothetical protein
MISKLTHLLSNIVMCANYLSLARRLALIMTVNVSLHVPL